MTRWIAAGETGSVAQGSATAGTRWIVLLLIAAAALMVGFVAVDPFDQDNSAASMTLHEAAKAGDRDLVGRFLADGANIDERDAEGRTPIYMAGLGAMPKMVDKLLVEGADASIRDNQGLTVLHAAASSGDAETVSLFIGDGPFFRRVELDDHANEFGITPVMAAAKADRAHIVAHLVLLGADPTITDKAGLNALTYAGQLGHDDVVTILLRLGAECQDIDLAWKATCEARKAELGK